MIVDIIKLKITFLVISVFNMKTTVKKTQAISKPVEPKKVEKFTFVFACNLSIGWKVYAKDSTIELTEEELKIYRPYVKCPEETIKKQPCKRC